MSLCSVAASSFYSAENHGILAFVVWGAHVDTGLNLVSLQMTEGVIHLVKNVKLKLFTVLHMSQ